MGLGPAYLQYEEQPILLKRLLRINGITQNEISALTPFKRKAIGNLLNRAGYFPGTPEEIEKYRKKIEHLISTDELTMSWLTENGFSLHDIWQADAQPQMAPSSCKRAIRRLQSVKASQDHSRQAEQIDELIDWEVEMVSPEAKKMFKLFKDPFIDDIQQESDIYMSEEHRYIEAVMLDAARHSGFLAVVGEVGSGKSIIRKKVLAQLKRDNNIMIIYPQGRDKSLLTASAICDSIVYDISTEAPKNRLEDKTRQVTRLLTERANDNCRHCLMIEEAHDLSTQALKHLKRFYELEDGFRRLLGIIMVGQLEMKRKLDERSSFDAREVIRRCQIVELGPLSGAGDLEKYLSLKFKRCGVDISNIFADDAYQAIRDRLTIINGKSKISHCYPLLINNYAAKALTLAARCGQKKVTAEVVYEI